MKIHGVEGFWSQIWIRQKIPDTLIWPNPDPHISQNSGFANMSESGFAYVFESGFAYMSESGFAYMSESGFAYMSVSGSANLFRAFSIRQITFLHRNSYLSSRAALSLKLNFFQERSSSMHLDIFHSLNHKVTSLCHTLTHRCNFILFLA